MINKVIDLFASEKGKKIFTSARTAINEYSMDTLMNSGVLLGLSGGADSVMMLCLLMKLKQDGNDFPLLCVHVNHMIRGNEADRDEEFCKMLCASLCVELVVVRRDIPAIASLRGIGTEEAARDVRYAEFARIVREREDISSIAVAHNATDNLETIIFNMMRGAGISGLAGIKPVRDNIFRPLITVSKKDITEALCEAGIEYVTDSTNLTNDYTRNYIRNEILPKLEKLNPSPEQMGARISKNLLDDKKTLDRITNEFIMENLSDGKIAVTNLLACSKSEFYRVLTEITGQKTDKTPERCHADAIYDLLSNGDFSYSLPGKIRFVSRSGYAYIESDARDKSDESFCASLSYGVNRVNGFSDLIIISDEKDIESYSNIYKISIQARVPSDIIRDGICVRNKRDGDSYFYGGINRKLKKLFNDAEIPKERRNDVPVICDEEGILWVPGFGVRCEEEKRYGAVIAIASECSDSSLRNFYIKMRKSHKIIQHAVNERQGNT